MVLVRNHIQVPITVSSVSAGSLLSSRRMVASEGARRVTPTRVNVGAGASAAHSAIAVNDRAPASVAAIAMASTVAS